MSRPRLRLAAPCIGLLALSGCGGTTVMPVGAGPPLYPSAQALRLVPQPWNLAGASVGKVAAATELADELLVLSDTGAWLVAGGAVLAQDPTVVSWRGAATIPAADGSGDWAVAIDGGGQLYRLRQRMVMEGASDRYGLARDAVLAATRLGGTAVAFGLATQLVVSDGATVTRFDEALTAIAGGGGRVAGVAADGSVHLLDPRAMTRAIYPLTDAVGVAFGLDGKLVVASRHALYREGEQGLVLLYADPGASYRAPVASAGWIWIADGGELVGLDGSGVHRTQGLGLVGGAQLVGSSSGDAWAVAGGALSRYAVPVSGDEATWRSSVLPVYARVCSSCHDPGGTSGFPLATYAQWVALKAAVYDRVVVKRDMPQGRTISDADRTAIAAWSMAH